jgi:GGDEF domain-containing protein
MDVAGTALPTAAARSREISNDPLLVDALTGFGSRRALLDGLVASASEDAEPTLLVVFCLDGFDDYVSLFGSLAGRTLVVKLAARLADALGEGAVCFRPRQDEFAALVATPVDRVAGILDAAVVALRERAASVAVTASWGAAMLPDEATDPIAALQLADSRLASNAPRRRRRNRRANPQRR